MTTKTEAAAQTPEFTNWFVVLLPTGLTAWVEDRGQQPPANTISRERVEVRERDIEPGVDA